MNRRHLWWALLACACGSAGSVKGTVGGRKIAVADAVIINNQSVVMSNEGDLCERLSADRLRKNETQLTLTLRRISGGLSAVLDVEDYPAGKQYMPGAADGRYGSGVVRALDADCKNVLTADTAADTLGSIALLAFEPDTLARGSFSLGFGDPPEFLSGTFNAQACALGAPMPSVCE